MPRGRKNKSLDERIQDTQQSIYNLEVRTQELYEELEELLRQKKNEELENYRMHWKKLVFPLMKCWRS